MINIDKFNRNNAIMVKKVWEIIEFCGNPMGNGPCTVWEFLSEMA